ncbi:MAG: hypothetical protein HY200_09055 [Nitrospirae bacterium]|nr:hypothetical protein [Nitrospirota bacterium]
MFSNAVKQKLFVLFFFIIAGCGLGAPGNGHDPNLPLPVIISDLPVIVDHKKGAIIITPDGMAKLSISQTALSADTTFQIVLYRISPKGGPVYYLGLTNSPDTDPPGPDHALYSFSPVLVPNLIPGQKLTLTLYYDPVPFPMYEPRIVNSPTTPNVVETDLRLGVLQDNGDYTLRCWEKVFLDAPSIIPGQVLHNVTTHDTTELGIFGVTSFYSYTCSYNFIYPPH